MKIGVVGLGYVGLPLVLAMGRKYPGTVGFDVSTAKILELKKGMDRNGEFSFEEINTCPVFFTDKEADLTACDFFIVAVPTPVDSDRRPDLKPLVKASQVLGTLLKKGTIIVYESTVYPGVTEDICGPILADTSGLIQGVDFHLGYSPERINPGDSLHTLDNIIKVVAGDDLATLDKVAEVYGGIIHAGVHRAPTIRVAEAAKVIENTQRDINIALMNELAIIFDRMDIRTADVLEAASTKWNFLRFHPGLVGGHCIGVDPYYLTSKAEQLGYHPQVILSGRRINDGMGAFLAQKTVKLMIQQGVTVKGAKVGILGLTFKENVRDLRNSRIPDIVDELTALGVDPMVHDPMAGPQEASHEYGLELKGLDAFMNLDALILAVPHRAYLEMGPTSLCGPLKPGGLFVDVKAVFNESHMPEHIKYWSL